MCVCAHMHMRVSRCVPVATLNLGEVYNPTVPVQTQQESIQSQAELANDTVPKLPLSPCTFVSRSKQTL